ncbi:MAG TPA: Mth938-like domain-containing protein [Xanthomonadales bacterium]|nr:Mth938-like domain-containing protein [Xanthomonadales bacterium]
MDLTLERPGDHHFIRSIGDRGIRIGDAYYLRSLIVSAQELVTDWVPQHPDELEEVHLQEIIALQPEVVLLGTGSRQHFLAPRDMYFFYRQGIGIEVMTTDAACRTFNVLVTEGRPVAAALMPFTSPA